MLRKLLRWSAYSLLGVILLLVAINFNLFWLFGKSPSLAEVRDPDLPIASSLYTADSVLIGRYFSENRIPVVYDSIPQVLIDALIATEDHRFRQHYGIDFPSLLAGLFSTAQGDKRGASTLTQQLAKNLFKTRRDKSRGLLKNWLPIYKIKEWITAVKLEWVYSKEEILTLYLNSVPFGNNTFGIKTASRKYFNKNPQHLELTEAALLVGMLKATSTYNPFTAPDKTLERRNVVLAQMEKRNLLDSATYRQAIATTLQLEPGQYENPEDQSSYIRSAVADFLKEWADSNNLDLYGDGLKIYTTIDSRMQQLAENTVKEKMLVLQRRFRNQWGKENPWRNEKGQEIDSFLENQLSKLPAYKELAKKYAATPDSLRFKVYKEKRPMKLYSPIGERDTSLSLADSLRYYLTLLQTGMMTLEPATGHIKVWVGGLDHRYFQFDHVYKAKRQAGSTFKPFAYVAALENGFSPCDRFRDEPVTIEYMENGEKKKWSPHNSDWVFTGYNMTLRWAMGKSCNSVTAQLTEKVGWDKVVQYAHRCGIKSELANVPSICLGVSDVSIYEMVAAYGTFLQEGQYTEPLLVAKVCDRHGNVLREFYAEPKPVLKKETAWQMLHLFKGGIEEPGGTSQALWEYDLFKEGNDIGGKTGTSNDQSDGWYLGITNTLVTGVWVGADERSIHFKTSDAGEGSKTALPIYGRFMERVYQDPALGIKYGKFPEGVKKMAKEFYCPNAVPAKVDSLKAAEEDALMELMLQMPE